MKEYHIYRSHDPVAGTGGVVVIVRCNGAITNLLTPDESLKHRQHSPTGFEYGYHGSGPAQLALALMLDAGIPAPQAGGIYQLFKAHVIARMPNQGGVITDEEIKTWMNTTAAESESAWRRVDWSKRRPIKPDQHETSLPWRPVG